MKVSTPKIMVRSVARALEKALLDSGSTVHWVQVFGESSLDNVPSKVWPFEEDPLYNLVVQLERGEGTLILITSQASRYKPLEAVPLIQLKLLTSNKRSCDEIPVIMDFLSGLDDLRKKLIKDQTDAYETMSRDEFERLLKPGQTPVFDVSKGGFVIAARPDLGVFQHSYRDALETLANEQGIRFQEDALQTRNRFDDVISESEAA